MPGANQDKLPTFRQGERPSAKKFNALVDAIRQQSLTPGSFQSGAFSLQRRVGGAATSTDRRLIGGLAVGAVADTDATFLIDNVVDLAGGFDPSEGNPATQVRVANTYDQEHADNEYIQAIYSEAVVASPLTDWESITKSVDENPPLRRFELTVAKTKSNLTATGKWLDHANNMIGSAATLHDPHQAFYGKPANYVGTIAGFRGFALLQTDLADVDPDEPRWVIIALEGYAETVLVNWIDNSPTFEWQLESFYGDHWEWKRPVADDGALTVDDPLDLANGKEDGDQGIAILKNPDTTPPTYELIAFQRAGLGDTIIVKISGTITGLSGTTRGSGTAQPVNKTTMANEGSTITVYNTSKNTYEGGQSDGPLFCLAHRVDGDYFIDPTDLRSITDFADNKYLGVEGGEAKWRTFQTTTLGITGSAACADPGPGVDIDIDLTSTAGVVVVIAPT